MPTVYYTYIQSPVGPFLVAGTDKALSLTSFTTGYQQRKPQPDWRRDDGPLSNAIDQFAAYFEGEPVDFDLSLAPVGTPFQRAVWETLQTIPHGTTWSYGQVASRMGSPGASRAIGAANAANHLPIVIPCHRVIGADGTLTGFGGGLETKAKLLKLEGVTIDGGDAQLRLID